MDLKTEQDLIGEAWQKTNVAANGNIVYFKHTLEQGVKFAEIDKEGKIVEIRNQP